MKDIIFTLSGATLWICDMRPGVTKDGTSITLPRGQYRCRVIHGASVLRGIEYTIAGRNPTREETIGEFSIDMARIGIVELESLLALHDGDWAALSDWSDEAADQRPTAWGGRLRNGIPHAVFFDIGGDCDVEVLRTFQELDTVGFRLRPKEPKAASKKVRKWTWVEVKVRGFGESWSFCDDWDYEPDDDDLIYDDIESGLSWDVVVSEHPDTPLHNLCPKFKGVDTIKVYTEEACGQEKQPRKKLKIKIPIISEFPTASQLKEVILGLFKQARIRK